MPYFVYESKNIFYRESSETGLPGTVGLNKPLLIILPGNTSSSTAHTGELKHFSSRYHAVSIDFLGTGSSDRIAEWPENWIEGRAKQTDALIGHLGADRAILAGTSGGGMVALLTAVLYPERVAAVIADSCAEKFTPDMLEKNVIQGRAMPSPEQIQFWEYTNGPDWAEVIEKDTIMLTRFAQQGGDCFKGRLSEVRCPVLLTASRQDSALPGIVKQFFSMAEQIKNSSVFLHNKGDHPLMWTRPEAFRGASEIFITGIK